MREPVCFRISSRFFRGEILAEDLHIPSVGLTSPKSIFIVVLFPARLALKSIDAALRYLQIHMVDAKLAIVSFCQLLVSMV